MFIGRENIKFVFVRENHFVAVPHWRTDIIICLFLLENILRGPHDREILDFVQNYAQY